MKTETKKRLEYLRGELRAERISYGELSELQGLAEHIPTDDVELREAAGMPDQAQAAPESATEFRDEALEMCNSAFPPNVVAGLLRELAEGCAQGGQ